MPKSKVRKKNGRPVSGVKRPRIRRKNLVQRLDDLNEINSILAEAEEEYYRRYGDETPPIDEDEETPDAD